MNPHASPPEPPPLSHPRPANPDSERDKSKDKRNFFKNLLSKAPWLWKLVQSIQPLRRWTNRAIITKAIMEVPPRPNPLCCGWDYPTWEGLTNTRWAGRHLGPSTSQAALPSADEVSRLLFVRRGALIESEKSTLLFPYFAQWFTDGFLAADLVDRRRTHSNHQIDLSQLYGLHAETARLLREGNGGLLKHQIINGAEFPQHLYEKVPDQTWQIRPEFRQKRQTFDDYFDMALHPMEVTNWNGRPNPAARHLPLKTPLDGLDYNELPLAQSARESRYDNLRDKWFAMGNERANSTPAFLMMNVLMLREHNRLARMISADNPSWDDERVFQTTRNVLTVIVLKIVLEEYINHIAPYHFRLFVDPTKFWPGTFNPMKWRWTNWMTVEFNVLYRWHSTIPDSLDLGTRTVPGNQALWNAGLVINEGLGPMFQHASRQVAGRIGAQNTSPWLAPMVEPPTIEMGRQVRLRSYNDYREMLGMPRATDFRQISGDPNIQDALRELYGTVDKVEYYAGMFAEDLRPKSALAPMVGTMVAMDAFSQALINPLLHPRLWNAETFSKAGWNVIQQEQTLDALVKRNTPEFSGELGAITMTRPGWRL